MNKKQKGTMKVLFNKKKNYLKILCEVHKKKVK